jgi:hypothetical protein
MAAAITATAVGNSNIEAKRIIVDMSNELAFLEPAATPLIVLSKRMNTKSCSNPKFEWMDNNVDVRWADYGTTASTTTATDLVMASGKGVYFAAGDLVKVPSTGEVVKVVSIATDTLTVLRAIGSSVAAIVPANEKLLILGNANMQGSGAPAEKVIGVTPFFNYTQIFKTPFSVTNTLEATKLYSMTELARLRKNNGILHAKSLEYSFLFGEKALVTSGAQPISYTGGLFESLKSNANNVTKTKASATEADLLTFCQNVFTYGGDSRTCLCSPDILGWIAGLASTKVQLIQSDKDATYGLSITKYLTPYGVLNLVMHPLLVQGYAGNMVALATEDLYYRPLQGRDTKLMTNIQLPDEDGIRDMYMTEAGMELRLPLKHGIFKLT